MLNIPKLKKKLAFPAPPAKPEPTLADLELAWTNASTMAANWANDAEIARRAYIAAATALAAGARSRRSRIA